MKNQFLQAIGYAIGVLILVPLAIYLINIFFFKPAITEKEINRFIDNSVNTEIVVWFDRPFTISKKYLGRHSKTTSIFLSKNGSGNYNYTSYTFYNKSHKKYYSFLQLAESGYIFRNIKKADTLDIKINKYFLNNDDYGTLENPTPVLY